MALESSQHTCMQGRQPWIEKDLLKFMPEAQSQMFEGNAPVARVIISQTGENFLDDGLHTIPAVFGTNSDSDSLQRSVCQLENGMLIRVLQHSYIFQKKDDTFKFLISVSNWENITLDLPVYWDHLPNVNSLETVKSCLQNCILNMLRDNDSASEAFLSQVHDASQSLTDLVKLANQMITSSESQQRSQSTTSQLSEPAYENQELSSKSNCTSPSSNCRVPEDVGSTEPSVEPMKLTSNEVLPSDTSMDKTDSNWQPNQELQQTTKSNTACLPHNSSVMEACAAELQSNHKLCSDSQAEQSVSVSQLLEMMLQDTEQSNGHKKCDQEKLICPGPVVEREPAGTQKPALVPNGKVCELQSPTFEDLFVPSDQRRLLALIQEWCLSDGISQSSSQSPAFLSSSSPKNSQPLSESLFEHSTMAEETKCSKSLPRVVPLSDISSPEITNKSCLESNEANIGDKLVLENEQSKNSSASLFSDTEQDGSSFIDVCMKSNESRIVLQQNSVLLPLAESNESESILQKDRDLISNSSDILKGSGDIVKKMCDSATNDEFEKADISKMDESDCLKTGVQNAESDHHLETSRKQNGKYVDNKTEDNSRPSRQSNQEQHQMIGQISSTDGTLDCETSYSKAAAVANVIDLSSTDDIYTIAGHDFDTFSENLVSSTDSEFTSQFHPCHISTQTDPPAPGVASSGSVPEDPGAHDEEFVRDSQPKIRNITSSPLYTRSSTTISSPENTQTKLQDHPSCTKSPDISRLNVSCQSDDTSGQTRDSVINNSPATNSDISMPRDSTLSILQKSTNAALKSTLTNVASVISKVTNVAAATQEHQLDNVPVTSDIPQKDNEHHLPVSESSRNSRYVFLSIKDMIPSRKTSPVMSAAEHSPSGDASVSAKHSLSGDVSVSAKHSASGDVSVLAKHSPSGDVAILAIHSSSGDVAISAKHSPSGDASLSVKHSPSGDVAISVKHSPSGDASLSAKHSPSGDASLSAKHAPSDDVAISAKHSPSGDVAVSMKVRVMLTDIMKEKTHLFSNNQIFLSNIIGDNSYSQLYTTRHMRQRSSSDKQPSGHLTQRTSPDKDPKRHKRQRTSPEKDPRSHKRQRTSPNKHPKRNMRQRTSLDKLPKGQGTSPDKHIKGHLTQQTSPEKRPKGHLTKRTSPDKRPKGRLTPQTSPHKRPKGRLTLQTSPQKHRKGCLLQRTPPDKHPGRNMRQRASPQKRPKGPLTPQSHEKRPKGPLTPQTSHEKHPKGHTTQQTPPEKHPEVHLIQLVSPEKHLEVHLTQQTSSKKHPEVHLTQLTSPEKHPEVQLTQQTSSDNHHPGKHMRKWTSPDKENKVQGQTNQNGVVSCSNKKRNQCQTLYGKSVGRPPKRRYNISVTEVGPHDQNILEIKQSPMACGVEQKSSHSQYLSDFRDYVDSSKIKNKVPENLVDVQNIGVTVCSDQNMGVTVCSDQNMGVTVCSDQNMGVTVCSDQNMGVTVCSEKERRVVVKVCRLSESVISGKKSISSGQLTANKSTKKITSSCHKNNHKVLRPLKNSVSDSVAPVIPSVPSLFSQTASYGPSDCRNVAPVVSSSCELDVEENLGNFAGQCAPSLVLPFNDEEVLDSLRFVPLSSDDVQGNCSGSVESSVGVKPQFTEGGKKNSDKTKSLHASAKLDERVASIVNYICNGKFL